jgi:hypothetical protein
VFEDVRELWTQYMKTHASAWGKDDPRHDLAAEVSGRLMQLDLVLTHLERAMRTAFNPEGADRVFAWMREASPKVDSGEMTFDEYVAGVPGANRTQEELATIVTARQEMGLFTEMFYFVAWRMVEVLNGRGPYGLPGVRVKAHGVRNVRNHLLEHPENHGQNFAQRLVVTSEGPVLKSMAAIVRHSTGRVEPDDDSVDRGLYANARELHGELAYTLGAALA